MADDGPKWRLEHANNNLSTCQQASCKRNQVKITKGELRIGTHTLFDNDVERRWYMAWRHWGCATRHQIQGLKDTTGDDPKKAPGYNSLSAESQEQVRLAFEEGMPVDKTFKGISENLAKNAPRYAQEYHNAEGYKADVAKRAAACRGANCLRDGTKIANGELRLGISINFDGDHSSLMYKHWKCMSDIDLEYAKERYVQQSFDGLDDLPAEYKSVVEETLTTGKVIEPPQPEVRAPKAKRSRTKKEKTIDEENDESDVSKPKRSRKKRAVEEMDVSEEEYVPKKTRSRRAAVDE